MDKKIELIGIERERERAGEKKRATMINKLYTKQNLRKDNNNIRIKIITTK